MTTAKLFIGILAILHSAIAINMVKRTGVDGYIVWEGMQAGTNVAVTVVKQAYENMLDQGGKAGMMACAAHDNKVYCASSARGGSVSPRYPSDLVQELKNEINYHGPDQGCNENGQAEEPCLHNTKCRCAEPMLMNYMYKQAEIAKLSPIPVFSSWAYGVGAGCVGVSDANYQFPCSHKGPTYGCKELLKFMHWGWLKPATLPDQAMPTTKYSRDPDCPAHVPVHVPNHQARPVAECQGRTLGGGTAAAAVASNVNAYGRPAALMGTLGRAATTITTPTVTNGCLRKRDNMDSLESQVTARALVDGIVEDFSWIEARDEVSDAGDLWVRDSDVEMYV